MGRHPSRQVLKGWKTIAAFLSVSQNTARRWAQRYGLPIHFCPRPIALVEELMEWIKGK